MTTAEHADGDIEVHYDGPKFAMTPEWILDADVCDRATRLWAVLHRYADQNTAKARPSRGLLAHRLHCSMDSIDRAVKELVAIGAMSVHRRPTGKGWRHLPSIYTLHFERKKDGRTDAATNGRDGAATSESAGDEHGRDGAAMDSRDAAAMNGRAGAALNETQQRDPDETHLFAPGSAERKSRKSDPLWDATLDVCGLAGADATSSERGAWNRAVKDLRAVNATPTEVVRRGRAFRDRWPGVSLTPSALARRWNECVAGTTASPVAVTEPFADGDSLEDRARAAVEYMHPDNRAAHDDQVLLDGAMACLKQNPRVHVADLAIAAETYAEQRSRVG